MRTPEPLSKESQGIVDTVSRTLYGMWMVSLEKPKNPKMSFIATPAAVEELGSESVIYGVAVTIKALTPRQPCAILALASHD